MDTHSCFRESAFERKEFFSGHCAAVDVFVYRREGGMGQAKMAFHGRGGY